jgi:4-aminobutyrate aminotransferase/(S)-3-amino-2-methylpropionate transaminase
MSFYRKLQNGLVVLNARMEHAAQMEELQRVCFPTLEEEERFKAVHYLKHQELFPAGQFVALDGERVVAATTTLRLHFDPAHPEHTFAEIIQGGWLTSHDPSGDWLYGADISTHPDYRGRGLARALYAARQELVWRLGLKGQMTAGMPSGYGAVKTHVSMDVYYARLVAGEINDPTVSMQIATGFEPSGLLANYLNDPVCDNYGVLLILPAAKEIKEATRRFAMSYIRMETAMPGPRAEAALARRADSMPAGLGRATDVVVERAEGALVHDVDGNTLIDLAGGIGMMAVGHSPQAVVEAIQAQASRFIHTCSLVTTYEPYMALAELLNEVTPGDFKKKTLLASSGGESVEEAIKLARKFTGRPAIVCFEGAYHGRTLLTLSLTSKYGLFKSGFGPFASDIVRLPFPNLYRRPAGMTEEEYVDFAISQLDLAMIAQVDPSAIAAFIIEPVQGEGGFVPVPRRYFEHIRGLCDRHRIVLIADEIQCGSGRTGKLFAVEHYGVVPDILVAAKSLGAGMPIGAITGRSEIMDSAQIGGIGSTYGGSPLACAAAVEALNMIRQPSFLAHANHLGEVMRATLVSWKERYELIGDVRGLGPMLLIELVSDRQTRAPLRPEDTVRIVKLAAAGGVILIRAGLLSNCIRFLPPLNMPEDMLREALAVVEGALATVNKECAERTFELAGDRR